LNFQYGQRGSGRGGRGQERGHQQAQNRGQKYERKKYRDEPVRPRYDHTHYLQANCQFTVRAGQDYSVQAADPDVLVDWDMIEQVKLSVCSDQATSCPICLFPPRAAKMSECGHVFCWTCILHYLALSDDKWRPCPICHKDITKAGLRSVQVESRRNYASGETIAMTLMKRERHSLLAVPATSSFLADNPEITDAEVETNFVKLFTASPDQVKTEILDKERQELEQQWEEEKDQPEACFVQEAVKLLDQRQMETLLRPAVAKKQKPSPVKQELKMPEIQTLSLSSPTSPAEFVDPFAEEATETAASPVAEDQEARPRNVSGVSQVSSDSVSSAEEGGEDAEEGVTVTDLDISTVQSQEAASDSGQPRQVFYFYQSSDGQPIFLHALNVQMLVKQYGALEKCPPVIQAQILEKEGAVMSDQLRDRLRYLKHLPVSTNFEVAELELCGLVDKETMAAFREQVEARRRARSRKLREERRREKKIQQEEARLLGFPGRMVRVESDYCSAAASEPAPAATSSQFPAMAAADQEVEAAAPQPSGAATLSFANITKTKPVSAAVPAPAPASAAGTTWACLGSVKPLVARQVARPRDSEDEEAEHAAPPPPQLASLGDTLAAALEAADTGTKQGKKGGKKGRGKTLLLTGGGGAARPHY